ncbi:hypothetical protein Syun_008407 [Stephania yunnanensis]|uniref:J domain-containing protein n=1 Tax=Stephania yunnanensis TaxID=152371 RepID=A0AAP0PMI4_9MAGN
MECNRDEAIRAKQIAERKFVARDIVGAKKFALKAQNLYPGLEGLPQMLSTLDVHLSAENKICGEADWYGILGANPMADDETVRKQYRKLALMLHPDKNKSVGSDGAFKLISEAWSLLSDKSKRTAYDQKRFLSTSQQKRPRASGGSKASAGANGFQNFSGSMPSNVATQKSSRVSSSNSTTHHSNPQTFWTACHKCKMQYEYQLMYLNRNLLCPNCHEPFLAVEIAAPVLKGSNSSKPWSFSQHRQNSNHHTGKNKGQSGFNGIDSFSRTGFQWGPFARTAGVGSASASASTAAQAASVVQQAYQKVKREREELAAARRREALRKKNNVPKKTTGNSSVGNSTAFRSDLKGDRPTKRRNADDDSMNGFGGNLKSHPLSNGRSATAGAYGLQQGFLDKDGVHVSSVGNKPNSTRELTQLELRNILAEKAKKEIRNRLQEWSLAAKTKGIQKGKEKESNEKETTVSNGNSNEIMKPTESIDVKEIFQGEKASFSASGVEVSVGALESMSIRVPDPDFHDFDRDRSESAFGANQVWAAYDNDDGMPRYYAMIHNVISLNPFKMRISWLNSRTNNELGPLNWVASGFSKTCGDFRTGRYEINCSLNSFSHKVRWTKGARGAIQIFPRKGDVWALFRNWTPDWNELTPDDVIHKYETVEVLDDFNEDQGAFVTPLVKVAGFKTVFHQHLDPGEIRRIPKEEMFRFSHQVPSYLLTGSEAQNAPKGCRELDPAATPLELLQVIVQVKEEEMENAESNQLEEVKEVEIMNNAEAQGDSKFKEAELKNVEEQSEKKIEVVNIENTEEHSENKIE